jgi:peptidyl-prolyl cis-trans isomerase C
VTLVIVFIVQVSECPSASRGGNLGTFKPGMMVKEFDRVVFEEEVGKVHGPVQTQFGSHLILITRRYEGEKKE